jgi:hypothetical protein
MEHDLLSSGHEMEPIIPLSLENNVIRTVIFALARVGWLPFPEVHQ